LEVQGVYISGNLRNPFEAYIKLNKQSNQYELYLYDTVYTEFTPALKKITNPEPGQVGDFISVLQNKLDEQLENPPEAPTLTDIVSR